MSHLNTAPRGEVTGQDQDHREKKLKLKFKIMREEGGWSTAGGRETH